MSEERIVPNAMLIDKKTAELALEFLDEKQIKMWLKGCIDLFVGNDVDTSEMTSGTKKLFEQSAEVICRQVEANTARVLRNREVGKKGGRPLSAARTQTDTSGLFLETQNNPAGFSKNPQQTENAQESISPDIFSLQAAPLEIDLLQDIFDENEKIDAQPENFSDLGGRGVISISSNSRSSSSSLSKYRNTSSRACVCVGACTCEAEQVAVEVSSEIKKSTKGKKKKSPVRLNPPPRESVVEFVTSNGFSERHGNVVYDYYNDGNWTDRNGDDIYNWKQKVRVNWLNEKHKREDEKFGPTTMDKLGAIAKMSDFKPA